MKDILTITKAAILLGVTPMTLRRWDKLGKFKSRRHPMNNYRLYRKDEVLALKRRILAGRAGIA